MRKGKIKKAICMCKEYVCHILKLCKEFNQFKRKEKKVITCHNCSNIFTNAIYFHGDIIWRCRVLNAINVSRYYKSKTIHINCPLNKKGMNHNEN